jgi:ribosomal protein S14
MPDTTTQSHGRKGYTAEDYREAVAKTGSMKGAARELGVTRQTVREQCRIHEIHVPSVGGVPVPQSERG